MLKHSKGFQARLSRLSLFNLCISEVSKPENLLLYKTTGDLIYLPYFIKNLIIRKVTKVNKGLHDDVLFKYLMNGMLEKLDLSQSTITDETLKNLAGLCLNLTEINFNKGLRKFTETGLIQSIPNLVNLVSLEIALSDVVTDEFIEKLAAGCKNITLLDIGGCDKITDRSMSHVKDLRLVQLNVSHTPISDDGLQSLSEGICSKFLVDLNISYSNVTKNGLRLLDWKKIKSLGIQGIEFGDMDFVIAGRLDYIQWTI